MDSVYDYISTNLTIKKKEELIFPYLDFGFLYGYGLFESVKIDQAEPRLLDRHLNRLKESSIILDIPFEFETELIYEQVKDLIKLNKCNQGVLNIYLTPGDRNGDPAINDITYPFLLMVVRKWPGYQPDYFMRVDVREQSFQRTRLDRYKTMAWMKNCMEHRFSPDSDDVVLYDHEQMILEASRSNVLFVKDSDLIVPDSRVVLNGVTQNFVCDHAGGVGLGVIKRPVYLEEVPLFDEVFLTNSLRGVALVSKFGEFNISSKHISRTVQEQYLLLIKKNIFSV